MTARALADELFVSERTIYRDVEALCNSGVPVYTQHGPGGGFALLDSYRTNLTGMTQDELRALFMLSVPAPLERLGVSQELRSALLKLSAALPSERRANEQLVHQRFLLDWAWFQTEEPVPHLNTLQQGVWKDQRVRISYWLPLGLAVENLIVDPYGLVAKAGAWFLVAARVGFPVVYRVSSFLEVSLTEENFTRRADFDLSEFWQAWCIGYEQERENYAVLLRIAPEALPFLSLYFGHGVRERLAQASPPDAYGRVTMTLHFESLESARGKLLALGKAVEVLEPEALRRSLIDFAHQIVDFYG
jgi:predicted DNA-binding transcriptional regulator YafY